MLTVLGTCGLVGTSVLMELKTCPVLGASMKYSAASMHNMQQMSRCPAHHPPNQFWRLGLFEFDLHHSYS
jgi:hypothetical protein